MGTVILTFNREDFETFRTGFFGGEGIEFAPKHREGRITRYVVDTAFSDLKLSLSKNEYSLAADLLNMAELEFQLEDELNL